jgi:hypothetical protein
VTIPLTSESAPAAAAQIDGDQMLIVELHEGDPKRIDWVRRADDREVERGMVAGGGRKGKRAEYRCAACGYGIVVYERPPSCPICSEARWEHVEWRPFSQHDHFSPSQSRRGAGTRSKHEASQSNAPSATLADVALCRYGSGI